MEKLLRLQLKLGKHLIPSQTTIYSELVSTAPVSESSPLELQVSSCTDDNAASFSTVQMVMD
jgi:hypothetical protein